MSDMDFSRQGNQHASCESEHCQTGRQIREGNKDSNETNFDTDRRSCHCGLRGDIEDPGKAR
jgi:hypothetical protein